MAEFNKESLRLNHEMVLKELDPSKPCFVVAAGGTAGHINPALAIADEIRRLSPDTQIVFCGNGDGSENELVRRQGYPFYWIEAEPFEFARVEWIIEAVTAYFRGLKQSKELLGRLNVKAVIGTGGFVSAPVISAAKSKGIRFFLHEQNAFPGKSTRSLSRGAACVFISYENTRGAFSKARRVVLTGNPVAARFFEDRRHEARERLGLSDKQRYVVATGGSLGAVTINYAVSDLTARLRLNPSSTPYHINLITGHRYFKEVYKTMKDYKDILTITEYAYDMPDQIAAADLVICRAGAGTCAELAAMGKPSILIPYPHAKGDHQTKNAAAFVENGAAILIADQDVSGQLLKAKIDEVFLNEDKLQAMGAEARALARPDAANRIACEILREVGEADE